MILAAENRYYSVQNLDEAESEGNQLGKSSFVHHFGVSDDLWNAIKTKYSELWQDGKFNGKTEEFVDSFYDTKDYILTRKNFWLRRRSFLSGEPKAPEWSLKTTEKNEISLCVVKEWKDEKTIRALLKDLLNSGDNERLLLNSFSLGIVVFFPTTRLIFEETDGVKFYVDCAGERYSKTWFLLGGIKFQNSFETSKFKDLKKQGYGPNVMSKIVQVLSWMTPEVFACLQEKGVVMKKNQYSECHIKSDGNPIFPFPM